MRQMFLIYLILMFVACSHSNESNKSNEMSWLVGEWVSHGSQQGLETKELWKLENDQMIGTGLVIKDGDTTFVENLSFQILNDTLNYVADVAHNPEPIYFRLTESSNDYWKFENPKHDFPKSIQYSRSEQGFTALVSGDKKSFELHFTRK